MDYKLFLHQSQADHKSAEVQARKRGGKKWEGVLEARNKYIAYCFMGNTYYKILS